MASVNRVIMMGNLTRDPELKYTPNAKPICDLSLALNYTWKGPDGQKKEEVSYIDVVTFGKQAENAAQYLKKGRSVIIEGRLQQDRWEDKASGQKRSKVKVIGERITFVGAADGQAKEETQASEEEVAF